MIVLMIKILVMIMILIIIKILMINQILMMIMIKIVMVITVTMTILPMATLRSAPSSIPSPTPDTISVSAQEGQSAFTSTPDQTIKKDWLLRYDCDIGSKQTNNASDTMIYLLFANHTTWVVKAFIQGPGDWFLIQTVKKWICWTYLVNWTTPCFETK